MEPLRWIMLLGLCLFLAEGFVLSLFPEQFQRMLRDSDPRSLQWLGLVETVFVLGLMAGVIAT